MGNSERLTGGARRHAPTEEELREEARRTALTNLMLGIELRELSAERVELLHEMRRRPNAANGYRDNTPRGTPDSSSHHPSSFSKGSFRSSSLGSFCSPSFSKGSFYNTTGAVEGIVPRTLFPEPVL